MLRWARGNTKKDIWREANIEPTTTFLRKTELTVWPRVKEGSGGYHQEDVKHESAGKEKKGRPNKRWLDNIREDMKGYDMTKDMAQNGSVWHTKTNAGPLLLHDL